MELYLIVTVLISLSAVFAYINHRYIRMPFVIGLFFLSTLLSLFILSSKLWIDRPYDAIKQMVEHVNISGFILNYMLGFLLFAGSLHTSWSAMRKYIRQISILAIGGVILSTFIIGTLFYYACLAIHLPVDFMSCLLFGALISPTDPIAVLGILTKAGVSKKIETIVVGESLFNDGVGVVIFIALLEMLQPGNHSASAFHFAGLFLRESAGGICFGLVSGFILHRLLQSIDHYETEILLTGAFVMAGYSICQLLHISGPLAMVVMGLMVGNYRQDTAMSNVTQEYVNKFWEVVDVILNAVLFILIAFILVVIDFTPKTMLVAAAAVLIILVSRVAVVYFSSLFFYGKQRFTVNELKLLSWGGLRGGLSIALVLSLPDNDTKNILLLSTYLIVVFSILVQGLTIEKMAEKLK